MSNKFLIGSDPEVFLRDITDGSLVSAIDIISNGKHNPLLTTHGAIQHDNILAEFNSMPATCLEEFINNHALILGDLNDFITPMGLMVDVVPSQFCEGYLLSDPAALVSGCDPDINAWTRKFNQIRDLSRTNLRVAGGHLHISVNNIIEDDAKEPFRIKLVKALDLVLGVMSVVHDPSVEGKNRKKLYGKAGAFRNKNTELNDPYNGIEYRTLSNYWLKDKSYMEYIYNGVEKVVGDVSYFAKVANDNKKSILSIINNNNLALAEQFISDHREIYA
jgi:hypothetical protein